MSVVEKVHHYQRSIEKCWDNEERMMHCISKLYQLPVTVQHLRDTGVGRTVNSLRKFDGGVGDAAKALVAKWKTMVANEDSSDPEEEDEACVPDAPESYNDSPESPDPDNYSENHVIRHDSEESRERSGSKSNKYASADYSSKSSSKGNTISEFVNSSSRSSEKNDHKEKHSKSESRNHEQKHDSKNKRHSSKHDSETEKWKNSKDLSQDMRKRHDSKDKNRIDSDVGRVSSSTESFEMNNKDNHRKRKPEKSERDKEAFKKKKYSESESEEENQDLIINSPVAYEPESPTHLASEPFDSYESGTLSKKNAYSCDKTLSRKETSDKEKHRNKEKSDTKHKLKYEIDKDSSTPKDSKKDDKRKKESKHLSKSKSSHSSSSSKDRVKNTEEKDKKNRREDKSKSSESKENQKDKLKKKVKKEKEEEREGIDSQSGTSFAEALGMCTMPPPLRKRGNTSSSITKPVKAEASTSTNNKVSTSSVIIKTESSNSESNSPSLLSPNFKLEPLSVDLAATLPEISPNYKPLAYNINSIHRKYDEDRSLSEVMYHRSQRTKVFSGNKTGYTSVPTLYELCIRVLIENIEALEVTGGVPYYIIKPVLERATPDQLFMLEHYNPYLIEDTDPLWQFHCNREFRTKTREEMESWRDMYMRCLDEREAKLKSLTANIKQSIDKSQPVRSTIQVHDDHQIKPPRNVMRKQAKYGTARDLPITSSEIKKKLISGNSPGSTTASCPPSPVARLKATSSSVGKKTKAPLMAKALQLIKGRYRR